MGRRQALGRSASKVSYSVAWQPERRFGAEIFVLETLDDGEGRTQPSDNSNYCDLTPRSLHRLEKPLISVDKMFEASKRANPSSDCALAL